jgi:hypothetical protein
MNPPTYEAWLEQCVIDRQPIPRPAEADIAVVGSVGTIPSTYIAAAIRDQKAGRLEIVSGLKCRGFTIEGDLHLESFEIPFPLFFDHCLFQGDLFVWSLRSKTISLEHSVLEKGADFRNSVVTENFILRHITAKGPVIARDMRITATADFTGASFLYDQQHPTALKEAAAGDSFGFSRSTAAALYWKELKARPTGNITFRDARVHSFVHDLKEDPALKSWPEPGGLILDGFRYQRFHECDAHVALNWLKLQPDFNASSYAELGRAFDRLHLQRAANAIWIALKKEEIRRLEPLPRRLFNRLVFSLLGYGERPWISLVVVAALFAAHFITVEVAKGNGSMEPTVSELVFQTCFYQRGKDCSHWNPVTIPEARNRFMPSDYPELSSLLYSLESFLPPLQFDQHKFWEPTNLILRIVLPMMGALGLFLGGLFTGSVAGLISLRKGLAE